jgi:hypothetical protein
MAKDMVPLGKSLVDGHVELLQNAQKYWKDALQHPGEKGRASEFVVRDVFEQILPQKYSIGTGFVVSTKKNSANLRLSPQQDIVVFDRIENPTRLSRDSFGLFPVEAVYGTIEVKERLTGKEIRSFLVASKKLRSLALNKQYAFFERAEGVVRTRLDEDRRPPAPRRFLLAMNGPKDLEKSFRAQGKKRFDAVSVHGLLTLNPPRFLRCRDGKITIEEGRSAFVSFVRHLISGLMSMKLGPLYPKKYFTVDPEADPS